MSINPACFFVNLNNSLVIFILKNGIFWILDQMCCCLLRFCVRLFSQKIVKFIFIWSKLLILLWMRW